MALQGRVEVRRSGWVGVIIEENEDQKPPSSPFPVYSNQPWLKWDAAWSLNVAGMVIHKGPKPLIPPMTESTGEVGGGEEAVWIPDELIQGGSIRPGRVGEDWVVVGGKCCFILKRRPPSYLFYISLCTSLFSPSPFPLSFRSFIRLSPSFYNLAIPLTRPPPLNFSDAPSLCLIPLLATVPRGPL